MSANISKVEVEVDAKAIVDMLTDLQYDNMSISPILEDCKLLVFQILQIKIKHCYREANKCANRLAKKSAKLNESLAIFDNPPLDILNVVEADIRGSCLDRLLGSALDFLLWPSNSFCIRLNKKM